MIWQAFSFLPEGQLETTPDDVELAYSKLMKYSETIGHNVYRLVALFELDGIIQELEVEDGGAPKRLVNRKTR